jgi:hypothetical protein
MVVVVGGELTSEKMRDFFGSRKVSQRLVLIVRVYCKDRLILMVSSLVVTRESPVVESLNG